MTMTTTTITQLAEKLSAAQAPFKAKYREHPETAQIVLHAKGRVAQEAVACNVDSYLGVTRSGLHPATGGPTGENALACSGDMLLQALIGCAGVTLAAVATAIGVTIHDSKITAEGDLDFRGTLGVDKTAAVAFTSVRINFALDTDANDAQLATLEKLTERYCVVYQTLAKGIPVKSTFQRLTTSTV